MLSKRDPEQNGHAIADEAVRPDLNQAFTLERLLHNQTAIWGHPMGQIHNVNLLAQDVTVADQNAIDCREVDVSANVYIVSNEYFRVVPDTGVLGDSVEIGIPQGYGAFAYADASAPIDCVRTMNKRCTSYAYSARMVEQLYDRAL